MAFENNNIDNFENIQSTEQQHQQYIGGANDDNSNGNEDNSIDYRAKYEKEVGQLRDELGRFKSRAERMG